MSAPERDVARRAVHVIVVITIAAAVAGYAVGTRPIVPAASRGETAHEVPIEAESPAPSYAELGSDERGAIGARQRAAFAAMLAERPARHERRPVPDEGARLAALEVRATRRAYDGAPPRIPHAIRQMETRDCTSCHLDGVRIGRRVAPAMSHAGYASCTQCHVVEEAPMPGAEHALESGPPIDTRFVGLASPTHGLRAWSGAPPQIPHPTRMRERCESCHGVLAEGLATSHPARQSCVQCHAPSARFDQPVSIAPAAIDSAVGDSTGGSSR